MKYFRIIAGATLLILILAACQPAQSGGANQGEPPVAATQGTDGYPAAVPQAMDDYPADSGENMITNGYPVLPGDEDKAPGNFFIESAEFRTNANDSSLTDLYVTGSLPTPCNEIRAFVAPPEGANSLSVKVYSVVDKDKICTQVLQPFEGVVTTFKDIPGGTYTVVANGVLVGEITIP